jgi:hypothetical protein
LSLAGRPALLAQQPLLVKGIAVRAGLLWVAETYGQQAVERVYAAGSPALRAAIVPGLASFGVLSSSWYDSQVVGELLDVIETVVDPDDKQLHTNQMAIAVADNNVKGVYQSLFRLISTRTLLIAHGQRVWRSYFNDGELAVSSAREGELQLTIEAPFHHDFLCRMTSAVIEQILKRIGFKGASLTRLQCQSRGASSCVFEVDYVV